MKATTQRAILLIQASGLVILHAVLVVIVVGCDSPNQSESRQSVWSSRQSNLRPPSEPKPAVVQTPVPDPQSEEILQQLEALRKEIEATKIEREAIEDLKSTDDAFEMEELRRRNEELQQALLALDGKTVPATPLADAAPSPVVTAPKAAPRAEEYFVRIMGVLPNPEGNERVGEAAELLNLGAFPVSMEGWLLKDLVNSSWKLDSLGTIRAGEMKTIYRQSMNMGLNNGTDVVRLISPDGTVVDEFGYEGTVEGVWIRRDKIE